MPIQRLEWTSSERIARRLRDACFRAAEQERGFEASPQSELDENRSRPTTMLT
jgi:hypothetical protein